MLAIAGTDQSSLKSSLTQYLLLVTSQYQLAGTEINCRGAISSFVFKQTFRPLLQLNKHTSTIIGIEEHNFWFHYD
jgi:hypothetical protein